MCTSTVLVLTEVCLQALECRDSLEAIATVVDVGHSASENCAAVPGDQGLVHKVQRYLMVS